VASSAGLEVVEKKKFFSLPGLELRPLGRAARSQSLYRLHYPGSRRRRRTIKIRKTAGGSTEVIEEQENEAG
jgi:hypothetical protein